MSWYESGDSDVVIHEIVQKTTDKIKMIQDKMEILQSRQKSYHDKKLQSFEFVLAKGQILGRCSRFQSFEPLTEKTCDARLET